MALRILLVCTLLILSTTVGAQDKSRPGPSAYDVDKRSDVVPLLDRGYCSPKPVDLRASQEELLEMLAKGDTEAALVGHFRDLRCLSAKNFQHAYDLLFEQTALKSQSPDVAAVVFLYLDMGGRLLDDRAHQWLKQYARRDNVSDALDELEFFAVSGASLTRVPQSLHAGLLASFDVSTWARTKCSLTDMIFDETGQPHCPEDFCPLVRDVLDFSELLPNEQLLAELCRAADKSDIGEIDKATRGAAQKCVDEFVARRSESELTCIVRSRGRPFDLGNLGVGPVPATVVVTDSCMISSIDDGVPSELDVLRARWRALQEEHEQRERDDDYLQWQFEESVRREQGHEQNRDAAEVDEAEARAEADRLRQKEQNEGSLSDDEKAKLATADAEAEAAQQSQQEASSLADAEKRTQDDITDEIVDNALRKADIVTEQEELEEEIKGAGGTIQCAQDDYGCSDGCTVVDEQLAAAFECTRGQVGDAGGGVVIGPDDPLGPDPDVTDPPDDNAPISPEFDQLTQCLSVATGGTENSCSTNLRCMDGAVPAINDFGFCACPSAPVTGPGETPCEWLIECPADSDEPCQCRSEDGGLSPVAPTTGGGLITIRP